MAEVKPADPQLQESEVEALHPELVILEARELIDGAIETRSRFEGNEQFEKTALEEEIQVNDLINLYNERELTQKQLAEIIAIRMAELKLSAVFDSMTGMYTNRAGLERGEELVSLADRDGKPLSVLMIDLDWFKATDDDLGHQAGDRVLGISASHIKRVKRRYDAGVRYGGDEFLVLLPETDMEKAKLLAIRLKKDDAASISTMAELQGIKLPREITFSIGVAELPSLPIKDKKNPTLNDPSNRLKALIKSADSGLLQAKRHGKDRIVVTSLDSTGQPQFADVNGNPLEFLDAGANPGIPEAVK